MEPGASVVLTQGLRCRPFSTAFFASSAAPIITEGLEVLVQEVIAAMATAPWSTSNRAVLELHLGGVRGPAVALPAGWLCQSRRRSRCRRGVRRGVAGGKDSSEDSSTSDFTLSLGFGSPASSSLT